jgi:hypothetical protein
MQFDAADLAATFNGTETDQSGNRQSAVEGLYFENYGFITDTALEGTGLGAEDAWLILEGVARHLSDYQGTLDTASFQQWVADVIKPVIAFYQMKRECTPYVYSAVADVLRTAVDLGVQQWSSLASRPPCAGRLVIFAEPGSRRPRPHPG